MEEGEKKPQHGGDCMAARGKKNLPHGACLPPRPALVGVSPCSDPTQLGGAPGHGPASEVRGPGPGAASAGRIVGQQGKRGSASNHHGNPGPAFRRGRAVVTSHWERQDENKEGEASGLRIEVLPQRSAPILL